MSKKRKRKKRKILHKFHNVQNDFSKILKKKCNVILFFLIYFLKHFGLKEKKEGFFKKKNRKFNFGHVQNEKLDQKFLQKSSFFSADLFIFYNVFFIIL
jgi:hypothetical protein